MPTRTLVVAAAALWTPSGALAQPPAPHAPPTDPNVLRGPSVPRQASIVHPDMTGRFLRVEGRPEEAAMLELGLDPEDKERAREVIDERASRLNLFLAEQVDLLKSAADALAARDAEGARRAAREMHERFEGSGVRDPLLEPLRRVLPRGAADELSRMVDEYWSAWIAAEARAERRGGRDAGDEGMREADDRPGARGPIDAAERASVEARLVERLFNEEIQGAYQRVILPLRQKLDRVYEVTEPTPEQRAAIREALIDYIREGRLRPSEEQRNRLVQRIYEAFSEDQRRKLFAVALAQI